MYCCWLNGTVSWSTHKQHHKQAAKAGVSKNRNTKQILLPDQKVAVGNCAEVFALGSKPRAEVFALDSKPSAEIFALGSKFRALPTLFVVILC